MSGILRKKIIKTYLALARFRSLIIRTIKVRRIAPLTKQYLNTCLVSVLFFPRCLFIASVFLSPFSVLHGRLHGRQYMRARDSGGAPSSLESTTLSPRNSFAAGGTSHEAQNLHIETIEKTHDIKNNKNIKIQHKEYADFFCTNTYIFYKKKTLLKPTHILTCNSNSRAVQ